MDGYNIVIGTLVFVFICCVVALGVIFYDETYIQPIAADRANDHCKFIGFDQHKSFNRIGLFSREPVAIKCEYAEKYTDLGVRTNVQS